MTDFSIILICVFGPLFLFAMASALYDLARAFRGTFGRARYDSPSLRRLRNL